MTKLNSQSQISIVYQPLIHLQTGKIMGYEAFTRPSTIFQEKNKKRLLATDIHVMHLAINQAAEILTKGKKIFVNVRPNTLIWLYRSRQKLFLPDTKGVVLELTEGETDGPLTVVKEAVDWIRQVLGCEIAIDDITSGYNRISYISELIPEYVKIDRPVVRECSQSERKKHLIKSLIDLADNLGAKIIAEGIELQSERAALTKLGVHFGQGYLFGKPSPLNGGELSGETLGNSRVAEQM